VQHALRAFTAKDRKAINKTAENYPISEFYKTEEVITKLGIGEAFVTALNEKGIPTPLAATLLNAPKTRMDILSKDEIFDLVASSDLVRIYNEEIDKETAYEILKKRWTKRQRKSNKIEMEGQKAKARKGDFSKRKSSKAEPSLFEKATKNTLVRQIGRTIFREITRGILGALGVKKR